MWKANRVVWRIQSGKDVEWYLPKPSNFSGHLQKQKIRTRAVQRRVAAAPAPTSSINWRRLAAPKPNVCDETKQIWPRLIPRLLSVPAPGSENVSSTLDSAIPPLQEYIPRPCWWISPVQGDARVAAKVFNAHSRDCQARVSGCPTWNYPFNLYGEKWNPYLRLVWNHCTTVPPRLIFYLCGFWGISLELLILKKITIK